MVDSVDSVVVVEVAVVDEGARAVRSLMASMVSRTP